MASANRLWIAAKVVTAIVVPAKAGIQGNKRNAALPLDPRLHGGDEQGVASLL
jgi:hypothetical protein